MFNYALYKQGIKSNFKMFLIFLAVITMYITLIITMYNGDMAELMQQFAKDMPEMMAMMGMNGITSTLIGFIISYLYGFILIIFPMVFYIMLSSRLVASLVDRGSMAYLLASPNKRNKIIFTQMKVIGTYIFILILYSTILSIVTCEIMFPGQLGIKGFLILNLGLIALHFAISGICFFASCIFNDMKNTLTVGVGLPLFFFIVQMLANMGGKLEPLKYATILTLFDPYKLIDGNKTSYIFIGVLLVISIVLYGSSILIFRKRDLSI